MKRRGMALRTAWRRFKSDITQFREMDRQIRELSDSTYAEVFGRYGTDEERAAFHRKFKRAIAEDARQREAARTENLRRQVDALIAQTKQSEADSRRNLEEIKAVFNSLRVSQSRTNTPPD